MTDTSSSATSQKIPGYQLLAKIGRGGMGTVYKARQISLDRIVAIKVLSRKYATNPQFIAQLHDEGKAAARLNHPNIVGALDSGEADGIHYFVMEYVEGNTVYDELMDNTRYDEDQALDVILAMAKALEHAHAAGIVHRDVKPQNMMISQGVVKLADMGLALMTTQDHGDSAEDRQMGSPFYMSPEQILGKPDIDFRTDIYSLGASFYYMVTGHPPFEEPTAREVLKAHLRKPLVPPRNLNGRISEGTSQIIEVCLAKVKEDRYDRTSDLVADLEAVIAGGLPLHAAGKLGIEDMTAEDAVPNAAELPGSMDSTSGSISISTTGDIIRPSHSMTVSGRQGSTQTMLWVAVAGWAAALVLGVLYLMK